jgi:acetylornithine/N-succinyldiaminopimelate aminotransferase
MQHPLIDVYYTTSGKPSLAAVVPGCTTPTEEYLDFIKGMGGEFARSFAAVIQCTDDRRIVCINVGPGYYNEPILPTGGDAWLFVWLDRVFFANGTKPTGAIKIARKWGRSVGVAHSNCCFRARLPWPYARHDVGLGQTTMEDLYEPKVPGFVRVPREYFGGPALYPGRTPRQSCWNRFGERPGSPFSVPFLRELNLTEARGVLLVFDKSDRHWAYWTDVLFRTCGVRPDIVTVGKGIGGGVPLTAVLARESSVFSCGRQGHVQRQSPDSCG